MRQPTDALTVTYRGEQAVQEKADTEQDEAKGRERMMADTLKSTRSWTPEPWINESLRVIAPHPKKPGMRMTLCTVEDYEAPEGTNAARIVLCVNALAGMTEADIDTMVQRWKERNR